MATLLQKNLAQEIVKNAKSSKKKNKQELVVSSGYSEISADRHATEILEQKGVKEELKNLGFSEEGAKQVVSEILYSKRVKPETRIMAAREVFKVQGSYAPEKRASAIVDLTKLLEDANTSTD